MKTLSINEPNNFKARFKNWWKKLKLKSAAKHVGLLIILMVYTVAGGLIFRSFEFPAEIETINKYNLSLSSKRYYLKHVMKNTKNLTHFDVELKDYEIELYRAFFHGVNLNADHNIKWSLLRSVFFSSTVLTTIGYGTIVPVTIEGRAFCMAFALIGIPLTLTVIADWGKLFAATLSSAVKQIPPLPQRFRGVVIRRTSSYAFFAVCFLFVYLAAGAAFFMIWEEDWTFFEGFYFCFITMTTIGFGDLVPKQPKYMLLCNLYILIGLALTSTIIELVRSQYAQSWRQISALQGPLADHFRRIADNAQGLDILTLQHEFMRVLTVSMPSKSISFKRTKSTKGKAKADWENALQAAIREIVEKRVNDPNRRTYIIIYETSV